MINTNDSCQSEEIKHKKKSPKLKYFKPKLIQNKTKIPNKQITATKIPKTKSQDPAQVWHMVDSSTPTRKPDGDIYNDMKQAN